jgi:hypothetical protein
MRRPETENVSMPESGHRRAIHATSTSALRAVAVLPTVVLLLAAAVALPTPRRPGAAAEHTERPARRPAQVGVLSVPRAGDLRS